MLFVYETPPLREECWSVAPDSSCDDTQGVVKVQEGRLPRMRANVTVSPCPWPLPLRRSSVMCFFLCSTVVLLMNLSERTRAIFSVVFSLLFPVETPNSVKVGT